MQENTTIRSIFFQDEKKGDGRIKIVFWSEQPGVCATTSNLAAISTYISVKYRLKSIIFQSQCGDNMLDCAFIRGRREFVHESNNYLNKVGIDDIIRETKSNNIDKNGIIDSSIELVKNTQYYIPATTKCNREIFEREIDNTIGSMLTTLEDNFDFVYVDSISGISDVNKKIMDSADIIITSLYQNDNFLKDFFAKKNPYDNKMIYVVGRYDRDSRYNITNIRRKYHVNNIGAVPYNISYNDAFCEGKVVDFIKKNSNKTRNDENYYFMKSIDSISKCILNKAGVLYE